MHVIRNSYPGSPTIPTIAAQRIAVNRSPRPSPLEPARRPD
jgi:hypothetical protein